MFNGFAFRVTSTVFHCLFLGSIRSVQVSIQGDDDWFLEKLEVIDTDIATVTLFPCTCWLDRGVNTLDESKQMQTLHPGK